MSTEGISRLLGSLGLCARARKLITGTPMVCEALKQKHTSVYLVLTASDNAENTAKRIADRCRFYNTRLVTLPLDGAALAHAVGKSGHVAAVAITDEQLCRLVQSNLERLS